MNAQVQKLEALLARVQHNRAKPRTASAVESTASAKPSTSDPSERAQESTPLTESKSTQSDTQASLFQSEDAAISLPEKDDVERTSPARAVTTTQRSIHKKTGTPLEAAVESHVESVVSPILEPGLEDEKPVTKEVSADADQPKSIPMVPMTKPEKAVAEVVSKHPPIQEATFGTLLKRTLSLRPR